MRTKNDRKANNSSVIRLGSEAQKKNKIALAKFCAYWWGRNGVEIESTGHMTLFADISFRFLKKNAQLVQDVSLVRITKNGCFEGSIWLEEWGFVYPELQLYSYHEADAPDHALTIKVKSQKVGAYNVIVAPREYLAITYEQSAYRQILLLN